MKPPFLACESGTEPREIRLRRRCFLGNGSRRISRLLRIYSNTLDERSWQDGAGQEGNNQNVNPESRSGDRAIKTVRRLHENRGKKAYKEAPLLCIVKKVLPSIWLMEIFIYLLFIKYYFIYTTILHLATFPLLFVSLSFYPDGQRLQVWGHCVVIRL